MERRIAMAVAASATVLLASASVGVAVFGGVSVLGFGAASDAGPAVAGQSGPGDKPKVVTRYRDVYDHVVIDTAPLAGSNESDHSVELSSTRRPEVPAGPATPVATPTSQPAAGSRRPVTPRKPASSRKPPTAPPTTVAAPPPVSATTSTSAPTTTTTWPRGVPRDWPPGKPIPPKPPGCRDGKLEDDGKWNCQH